MVAKKGKKSTRRIKNLPARKLSGKQAKGVKGGVQWGGSVRGSPKTKVDG
jgi:hypothetical protein